MKPVTSSRATGSFIPDSPSSERASALAQGRAAQDGEDRGRVGGGDRGADDQSLRACRGRRARSAARPAITAVTTVPIVASETAVPSTGRISAQPAVRPPSKRIRTRPIVPASGPARRRRTRSRRRPREPSEHAEAEEEQQARARAPGRRPSPRAIPAPSRRPAIRISSESDKGGRYRASSPRRRALVGAAVEEHQQGEARAWGSSAMPSRYRRGAESEMEYR